MEDWGAHWVSLGLTWTHLASLGLTWSHLVSLGLAWNHLELLGLTWVDSHGRNGVLSKASNQHYHMQGVRKHFLTTLAEHTAVYSNALKTPNSNTN